MADAIVSVVAEQLVSIVTEEIKNEIKLVRGVDEELLNLSDKLHTIRNVLDDAERKQFKDKTIKDWLRRLEQTSYEMEDVLEEWNYVILQHKMEYESVASPPKHKVCSFVPSLCFSLKKLGVRSNIAKKIRDVKLRLEGIMNEGDLHKFVISQPKSDPSPASSRVQSTSLIDSSIFLGQSDDRDILVTKLTARQEVLGYHILSIVGAGGLGKTTLAQLVYNDSRVIECFGDLRIWICVSNPFDVVAIAKGIIKSITTQSPPDTTQLDDLLGNLIGCISGKKFLLVLDDVWSEQEDKWEPLRNALQCGGANSKILVTTRKENVAKIMGVVDVDIHSPELLSEENCWLLLKQSAHLGMREREFEKIGKDIAKRCKGLPLAAKTLGSYLRFKHNVEEWKTVLKSEMWELENEEVDLFPHLLLSYNDLSPTLKRCFSFCAFFPKDEIFEVEKLVRTWMALGYLGSNIQVQMELKGHEYFQDLAMRSLFQEFSKDDCNDQIMTCKMHDIVHDFARYLRMNESGGGPRATKRSCKVCNSFIVDQVKEYRCLVWGVKEDETNGNICDCLASLRVLKYRSDWGGPKGMEKLIHLRWLDISGTMLSNEVVKTICKLYFLQTLSLGGCDLKEIPGEIGNLVRLRHLNLCYNEELIELPESLCNLYELQTLLLERCYLQEIPSKIGNLVQLRHLNLRRNPITVLPESMCGLIELQTLDIQGCVILHELPKGIHGLENLKHLLISGAGRGSLYHRLPQGISQLSSLRILDVPFCGGSGLNKLGLLKNLNLLNGSLELGIKISSTRDLEELVEDAREAELWNKEHIQELNMQFNDHRDVEEVYVSSWLFVEVIDALKPNHKLEVLYIVRYGGSRLPHWISSPLNLVKKINLSHCYELRSLLPMGKLPFLENLFMTGLDALKVVGGEWLGIRGRQEDIPSSSSSSSSSTTTLNVAFPKLRSLSFIVCPEWEEWEDITVEEEESASLHLMPCLTTLSVHVCGRLKMLPHRLLRKAKSLQVLSIVGSPELQKGFQDKDGALWRSISQYNPQLKIVGFYNLDEYSSHVCLQS